MSSDHCALLPHLHKDDVSHLEIFRESGSKAKLLPYKFPPDYSADDLGQDFGGGTYNVIARDRAGKVLKPDGFTTVSLDGMPLKPSNKSGKLPEIASGSDRIPETDMEKDGLPALSDFDGGNGLDSLLGGGPPRDVYTVGDSGIVAVEKVDPVAQMVSVMKQREDGFTERVLGKAFDMQARSHEIHLTAMGELVRTLALQNRGTESEAALKHKTESQQITIDRLSSEIQRLTALLADEQNRYIRLREHTDREIDSLRTGLQTAQMSSITSLRGTIESDRKAAMSDVTIAQLRMKTGSDKPTVLESLQAMAPAALPLIQSLMTKMGGAGAAQQALTQPVTAADLGVMG